MIYDDISRIMETVLFVILIYFIDGDYRYNTDHFFHFFLLFDYHVFLFPLQLLIFPRFRPICLYADETVRAQINK